MTTLTEREEKMLDLLVLGASSDKISAKLKLTTGTTRVYLHYLYKKLKVKNRTQAAVWWLRNKK